MAEIVAEKPINEQDARSPRTRSSFDLNYRFYNTMRFGEYTPHFWMEGLDNDDLPLRSAHEIQSYTLKSPLLSDIKMNKDYFYVPMMAILPLNWEKFITNPSIGQDVPADCGPSVADFWAKMSALGTASLNYLDTVVGTGTGPETAEQCLDAIFKFLVFFERIYSDGSLMSNLGIHGGHYFRFYRTSGDREMISFDQWFDEFILFLQTLADGASTPKVTYMSVTNGVDTFYVEFADTAAPVSTSDQIIGLRDYLELLRDDFTWTVSVVGSSGTAKTALTTLWNNFRSSYSRGGISPFVGTSGVATEDKPALDLRRLWAYQLVCWHFYSNDKVDFIYSAELFRQYIRRLSTRLTGSGQQVSNFTLNGLDYQYDALSGKVCDVMIGQFSAADGIFGRTTGTYYSDSLAECYAYFRALFGFNRSLRYKDYFTASRTRALAVGNTDVQVNSGLVSIIDVTRNIQGQRFLNFVGKIPRQMEDYFEGLFHKRPAPDFHNPFWLASTKDDVYGRESEYTGNVANAQQNNITSVLRSNAERYAFEFKPDRDCVVLGITSYDIPRAYSASIERQAMHYDRFDAFNPFFQYVGDQAVYRAELGSDVPTKYPFGYQTRHMEYKQRYDQCAGGFRKFLPGWLFIADDDLRKWIVAQNPDFIRSHNTELDRFYTSITGYSLASYFHFIVKNVNTMNASRPMAYAPGILG